MKHDIIIVLKKHIDELFQILEKYNVSDKANLIKIAEADFVFQKAILMSVGYIGELSKKLDENIKKDDTSINWRRLSASRNIIFHDYDIVDMEIITSVIFKDISALRELLNKERKDINEFRDTTSNDFS